MNSRNLIPAIPLYLLALIMGLFFVAPKSVSGEHLRAIDVVQDQEKRSSIHEVDGYAYLSENMTLAETRSAAFAIAKRQALEMARTYIKSKAKVAEGVLEYDLIWADAEGAVSILEQKDHGLKGNRYHVWIKAEVDYELKPKETAASQAAVMDANAPLTVRVWTDKKTYVRDEFITIFVQGNRDFYARIVDVASDGRLIQLLPNAYRSASFFKAGKTYTIPGPGDRFKMKIIQPFDREKVIVYASEVPIADIPLQEIGDGLGSYAGSLGSLGRNVRAIKPVPVSSGQSNAEFYEAVWALETKSE